MRTLAFLLFAVLSLVPLSNASSQVMSLNNLEYFETRGANILVYNNLFTGGFNDEKNAGIEIIHHGVRTAQGGAIRLSSTPEQWDLVPDIQARTVDSVNQSIGATLRYDDYDFESRVVVTPKGKGAEISVYLDADFSFIPGNVAPGLLFRQPDHFENYDDWPLLWGQNEGTIGGNTSYLIFGSVFKDMVK